MLGVILSSVVCPALPYFFPLFHKRHDFRGEKNIGNKMYVSICSSIFFSEKFLILRELRDVIINLCKSSCKVTVVLATY